MGTNTGLYDGSIGEGTTARNALPDDLMTVSRPVGWHPVTHLQGCTPAFTPLGRQPPVRGSTHRPRVVVPPVLGVLPRPRSDAGYRSNGDVRVRCESGGGEARGGSDLNPAPMASASPRGAPWGCHTQDRTGRRQNPATIVAPGSWGRSLSLRHLRPGGITAGRGESSSSDATFSAFRRTFSWLKDSPSGPGLGATPPTLEP